MKNSLFFVLFFLGLTSSSFSQSERDQKSSIRSGNTGSSTSGGIFTPSLPSRTTSDDLFQKQQIRRESQSPKPTAIYAPRPYISPWNRWGAPY